MGDTPNGFLLGPHFAAGLLTSIVPGVQIAAEVTAHLTFNLPFAGMAALSLVISTL